MFTLQDLDIKFSSSDIVIELDEPTNCNVFYKPLGVVLRSAWSQGKHRGSYLRSDLNPDVANTPDVPGLMLCLNVEKRSFRVIDPLNHIPSKDAFCKRLSQHAGRDGISPVPDEQWQNLREEKLATHWYWMKQEVERGRAKLINGKFGAKPAGRIVYDESRITQIPEARYDPKTGKGLPHYLDEKLHQDSMYDSETELTVPGK
jgi:hypothetical protein